MTDASNIQVILALTEPSLDDEEREDEIQNLLQQLRKLDEVERVERIFNSHSTEDRAKSAGAAALIGLLQAEVSVNNFKGLLNFLSSRLGNKAIKLEIEANGKKLKVKASSQQELRDAIQIAQEFINS